MMKILVAVTFGLLGAAMTSGCVVRSEPAVVVQPAPAVIYAQPAVVIPAHKYKYKNKGNGAIIVVR